MPSTHNRAHRGSMTLQARVSLALADRLDALVMRLRDEHPSRRIGRSEIIRAALLRFLDDADADVGAVFA